MIPVSIQVPNMFKVSILKPIIFSSDMIPEKHGRIGQVSLDNISKNMFIRATINKNDV